jgi:hypothetical protein
MRADGAFPRLLHERDEDAWHTWDCAFMARHVDTAPLGELSDTLRKATTSLLHQAELDGRAIKMRRQSLVDAGGRLIFHGGMEVHTPQAYATRA